MISAIFLYYEVIIFFITNMYLVGEILWVFVNILFFIQLSLTSFSILSYYCDVSQMVIF